MTGNRLSRAVFFWPGVALIRFGQFALRFSQTAVGRYTIRPALRLVCRFALYARPYFAREPRANEVVTTLELCDLVDRQRLIAVIPCACRAGRPACGNPRHTEHALDVCLSFGLAAVVQIGSGLGRRLSQEEAKALCEKATATGLAHHAIYSFGSLLEVCNCCAESCSVVKAYKAGVPEALRPSPFVAVRGPDCDGCKGKDSRVCEEVCPYDKRPSLLDCFGCDLCSFHCPRKAIIMTPREEWPKKEKPMLSHFGRGC